MEDAACRLKKEHAAICLLSAGLCRTVARDAPPGAIDMAAVGPDKTNAFDHLTQDTSLQMARPAGEGDAFLFQRPVRMLPPPWRPVSWPKPSAT